MALRSGGGHKGLPGLICMAKNPIPVGYELSANKQFVSNLLLYTTNHIITMKPFMYSVP